MAICYPLQYQELLRKASDEIVRHKLELDRATKELADIELKEKNIRELIVSLTVVYNVVKQQYSKLLEQDTVKAVEEYRKEHAGFYPIP